MLTNNRHHMIEDEVDFIHNYYERLVLQEVMTQSSRVQAGDREFMADVACVTLNRLPPRYIRHDVDMTFFMSPQDLQEIERKVAQSVSDAIHYVENRERGDDTKLPAIEVSLIANRASKPDKSAVKKDNDGAAKSGKAKGSKK